jgi:surfactin synthase thioesterase subunit
MDDTWIRVLRPAARPAARLVCFPHAGGSAGYFLPLAQALDERVEVLAVQYPGRQDRYREPVVTDIGRLADRLTGVLASELAPPYAFFGHSMGAVVAFEVTRRLRQQAAPGPAFLSVSGRRAPSVTRPEGIHLLDDRGLMAEVAALDGTDARLLQDPEVVAMVLPAIRGDYTAIETYRCEPRQATVDCPVDVLIGDRDPRVSVDDAKAWAGHTTAGCDLRVFPGGHFYLRDAWPELAVHVGGRLLAPSSR